MLIKPTLVLQIANETSRSMLYSVMHKSIDICGSEGEECFVAFGFLKYDN